MTKALLFGVDTNVREKPDLNSRVVATLKAYGQHAEIDETPVPPPGSGHPWHKIRLTASGVTGYVRTDVFSWMPLESSVCLDVPHIRQFGPGADAQSNDCGQACVAMFVHAYTSLRPTVDMVAEKTKTGDNLYKSLVRVKSMADAYGIALTISLTASAAWYIRQLQERRPVIGLVHYGQFSARAYPAFKGAHWLVVTGYDTERVYMNDPLGNPGWSVPWDEFLVAIGKPAPGNERAHLALSPEKALSEMPSQTLEQRVAALEAALARISIAARAAGWSV
jgi:hypothetical protein